MITINNSFSLKLKELRQKNNLTQEQLANELNTIGIMSDLVRIQAYS